MDIYRRLVVNYNTPFLFCASFLTGCACELVMIKWRVGETNFYDTVIQKESQKAALKVIEREQKSLI